MLPSPTCLLHRRGRRSSLHGQLLLHHVNLRLRGHHLLKLLLLNRCFLLASHQLVRAILQNVRHVVLVLTLVLCCVASKLVLERGGAGTAEFMVLHLPEIFGVRPRFVGVVAGDPIFIRVLVFPGLFDHRQRTCNNDVVGDFLSGKSCVCYSWVGPPVDAHKKLIYRRTRRVATIPRPP